jgi:predicted adenine nucleotide alpha hydrolase (AANH) superfamily ATPase
MNAEYFHVCMAASFWTACVVLEQDEDDYLVLFYDNFIEDTLEYWAEKDRVRFI